MWHCATCDSSAADCTCCEVGYHTPWMVVSSTAHASGCGRKCHAALMEWTVRSGPAPTWRTRGGGAAAAAPCCCAASTRPLTPGRVSGTTLEDWLALLELGGSWAASGRGPVWWAGPARWLAACGRTARAGLGCRPVKGAAFNALAAGFIGRGRPTVRQMMVAGWTDGPELSERRLP